MKFVIYTDGDEVIITTVKKEYKMLKMCFAPEEAWNPDGEGDRNLEDFERDISSDDSIGFTSHMLRNW